MNKFVDISIVILVINLTLQNAFAQSPYKTSWSQDGPIFGCGIAVAFCASYLDDSITPLTIEEINNLSSEDVNRFDKSATNNWSECVANISDIFVGACLLSPLTLFVAGDVRGDFRTVSTMYLETLFFSVFIPSFGKGGVQRIRPFVYNPEAPLDKKLEPDAKRSFPSGHTTCAFSSAVFLSTVYSDYYPNSRWKPYVWGGSLLAASMVGYFRYEAGAHFPTDVLTGAVIGSTIGYVIPWLHRTFNKELGIAPSIDTKQYRISFQYKF